MNNLDIQYQNLLRDILENGTKKGDRTGTGNVSVFCREIRHNMSEGFPLLTTKKMAWKQIVTELLWFLRGETNIKSLVESGNNIWVGDAYKNYQGKQLKSKDAPPTLSKAEFIERIKNDEEFCNEWGELGPVYGKQWRKWTKLDRETYGGTFSQEWSPGYIDQLQNLIDTLKRNPDDRRMMVTAWNPAEVDDAVLPPCHYGFQVYTRELTYEERYRYWFDNNYETGMEYNPTQTPDFDNEYYSKTPTRGISLMWNQRSVDTFLGLPFNIASYGLLLQILGQIAGMVPDELIGRLGDTHLYLNHIDQAKEQARRIPFVLPRVTIDDEIFRDFDFACYEKPDTSISHLVDNLSYESFTLNNYVSHSAIKAELSN